MNFQQYFSKQAKSNRSQTSHYYTNLQGWLQEPSQELLSCSPYITLNENTGKNISKKYPPIRRNAAENGPQATWLEKTFSSKPFALADPASPSYRSITTRY